MNSKTQRDLELDAVVRVKSYIDLNNSSVGWLRTTERTFSVDDISLLLSLIAKQQQEIAKINTAPEPQQDTNEWESLNGRKVDTAGMTMEPQQDRDALLNCPFCDHDAELTGKLSEDDFGVECSACRVLLRYFGSQSAAIAAWNKRQPAKEER